MSKKMIAALLLLLLLLFSACGSTQSEQFAEYCPVECNDIATILPNAVSAPTKFGTAAGVQVVLNWENSDVTFNCQAECGSFSTEKCQSTIDLHPGETLTWYNSAVDMDIDFQETHITVIVREKKHIVGYAYIVLSFANQYTHYTSNRFCVEEAYKYPKDGGKYQDITEQMLLDKELQHQTVRELSYYVNPLSMISTELTTFNPALEKSTASANNSNIPSVVYRTVADISLFSDFLAAAKGKQVTVVYSTEHAPSIFIFQDSKTVLYYEGFTGKYYTGTLKSAA